MDLLTIVLRIVHIGSGVLWVGGSALFFLYLEPTINKLGPDAEKFVDEVVNKRKVPIYFAAASTLTVLGGAILYWRFTNGLHVDVVTSASGLAFGIGGIAAVVAWVGSNLLIPSGLAKLGAIGKEIQAAGGPPSPALLGRMHAAQERLHIVGLLDMILLAVAVLGMASARYL